MSLIAAVKNSKDIVIVWDSMYTDTRTGKLHTPPDEVQKVIQINPQLAFMLTGTYDDTHVKRIKELVEKLKDTHELDEAFKDLYHLGSVIQLTEGQGFQMTLAGYIEGKPTFRFVMRAFGDPNIQYVNEYPLNFFLSGDRDPVVAAEKAIRRGGLTDGGIPTNDIKQELKAIVDTCIREYPKTLESPANMLVLTHSV